jgi:Acyclic terpene utilisation family protein AtuA
VRTVNIGCGSSCGSCRIEEANKLLDSDRVSYLCFDRLAERTTSEMLYALSSGGRGFCPELELYMSQLASKASKKGVRLITNAGGEDPEGAFKLTLTTLRSQGAGGAKIAALLPRTNVLEVVRKVDPQLVESGKPFSALEGEPIGASVYHTCRGIVGALEQDADVVITGRVGDSALYLAPLVHEFGWAWDAWDTLARGMAVGHMMECGPQLTGGYFAAPPQKMVPDLARVGLPYAEVSEDGNVTFTKLETSGGKVTLPIAREQMLYEVGDPSAYMHTDAVVDFTTAELSEVGPDRVRMENVSGHPRPETLKVLVSVHEGFLGESYVTFGGSDAYERAKFAAELMRERINVMGLDVVDFSASYLGIDSLFSPWAESPRVPREVTVHLAGRFATRSGAQRFVEDSFIGAGNHYGPAGGTTGRTMMPVESMPSIYTTYIDRALFDEPELVIEEA